MIRRKSRTAGSEDFLPEAELEVLAVLHERGEAEASTIRELLDSFRPLSHSSVVTLLRRLEDRGLVSRRPAGSERAFIYFPTKKAAATQQGIVERMLQRIFRDRPVSLVASLFEVRKPDAKEIAQLRSLFDAIRMLHRHPPALRLTILLLGFTSFLVPIPTLVEGAARQARGRCSSHTAPS